MRNQRLALWRPSSVLLGVGLSLIVAVAFAAAPDEQSPSTAKSKPVGPPKDYEVEDLVEWIIDRRLAPVYVRRRAGYVEGIVVAADRILAFEDAGAGYRSFAVLAKLDALHEATVGGDKQAAAQLDALAETHKDDTSRKVKAFVDFYRMERKILAAAKFDQRRTAALLDELKAYLAGADRLSNRHLRLAEQTVNLIGRMPKDQQDRLFREFGKLYAQSIDGDLAEMGRRLGRPPGKNAGKLTGKTMQLSGLTADGFRFSLKRWKGDVVLVDFWATWCGPCVAELPKVRAAYDRYGPKGLQVVGVSLDSDQETLKRFLGDNEILWPTLAGRDAQQAAAQYGVRAIPTMFVVDRKGKIAARGTRIDELTKTIEHLLKQSAEEAKPGAPKPPEPKDPDGAPQKPPRSP